MDPIDEIKQKLDIVDLVGGYVEIKKAGKNYKGLCPFHSEKTPSMMVSPELQIYKCFGCGEGGDIFNFHQKVEGLDFVQSLEQLAEKTDVKLPKRSIDPERSKKKIIFELNELSAKYYQYLLTEHKVGKKALKYLKDDRGLTDETIEAFNLGYAPDSWDSLYKFLNGKKYKNEDLLAAGLIVKKRSGDGFIDKFRKRIIFPLIGVDGKVVGFTGRALGEGTPKYLNSPETLVFHKSSYLYGLDKSKVALKQEGALFVEDQMDVISAYQGGIGNVVASSGTSLTVGQLRLLSRYSPDITFAFDSDLAGLNAVHRAIDLSEKQGFNIKVVMIPEEYADLDEFVRAKPRKSKKVVTEGIPAYDFFLVSALRRHKVESPIGKKKAMSELVPIFSKISDPVLRDHYIKKISDELDVTESVVASVLSDAEGEEERIFSRAKSTDAVEPEFLVSKRSPEEYILALVLKAPLDTAQTILYKLGQKDFESETLQVIFTELKEYLRNRKKKFEIHHFVKKFEEDVQALVNELYLWDLGSLGDSEEALTRELESIFELLKKKTAKRELKELSTQIKQAETEKNEELLTELSQQFKELSEKLI